MSAQRRVGFRRGTACRPGFTLLEVIIVMMIVALLGAIAVPQFGQYTDRRAVNDARDTFIRTAAQARAAAIRTGDRVEMHINPAADLIAVITSASDTVAKLDLRNGPIKSNLLGTSDAGGTISQNQFRVCYVPRGYALPACGTNTIPRTVHFSSRRGHTASALVTVGQAERL